MVWYSVFYLLSFFFRTQWNLHAEENTYCLRIIHNKYLKEGNMLRRKLVEKLVLCVSGEREILWRSGLCRQFEGIYIVQENTCCLCIILEKLKKLT